MIASLEQSSSSKNYNGDHGDEGGGRRPSSQRANEIQRLILRPKSNDIPRPIPVHPTRFSALFPRGGQYMIYPRSVLLALVLVVVLVPIRGKSPTRGPKEKI